MRLVAPTTRIEQLHHAGRPPLNSMRRWWPSRPAKLRKFAQFPVEFVGAAN